MSRTIYDEIKIFLSYKFVFQLLFQIHDYFFSKSKYALLPLLPLFFSSSAPASHPCDIFFVVYIASEVETSLGQLTGRCDKQPVVVTNNNRLLLDVITFSGASVGWVFYYFRYSLFMIRNF